MISEIARALWLAERHVSMRVHKNGCALKMFGVHVLITQAQIWKSFLVKNSKSSLYLPLPRQLKLGKSLQTYCVNFFWLLLTFWARKISILESIFIATKQETITRARHHLQDFATVRTSLLISAITKSSAFFLGKLTIKAIENFFPVFA